MRKLVLALVFGLAFASAQAQDVANPQTDQTKLIINKGQLPGTVTNNNASAGNVGEYQTNTGTAVAVTTGAVNGTVIATLSLTAGDWSCSGNGFFNPTANTVQTYQAIWTATTATLPVTPAGGMAFNQTSITSAGDGWVASPERYSLSGTTSVNLYMATVFTLGTGVTATATLRCWRTR